MWECPDFFPLDGKWVLILSPIEMERQQEKYWNLNSTVAFIGDMNWETGRFHVDSYDELDGGLDFYAPSNLSRTKWRTIHGCLDANVAPVYPQS